MIEIYIVSATLLTRKSNAAISLLKTIYLIFKLHDNTYQSSWIQKMVYEVLANIYIQMIEEEYNLYIYMVRINTKY